MEGNRMFYNQEQILDALSTITNLKLILYKHNIGKSKEKKMTRTGLRNVKIAWAFSPEDIDSGFIKDSDVLIIFSDGIRVPGTYLVMPHENFIGSDSLWKEKLRIVLKNKIEYNIIHPDLIRDCANKEKD